MATLLAGTAAACSAPRHLIAVGPDTQGPGTDGAIRSHRIFIATTRAPSSESGVFFSGQRSGKLSFASVDVQIPPNHVAGQVERPRSLPPDPDRHFVISNPQTFDGKGLLSEAEAVVSKMPRDERKLLIWVHGFNSTLSDAVMVLAQFVEDTGFDGVPLLFSWASAGRLTSYVYDINSALIARDAISDVAKTLGRSSFGSIDIVAHSMGNFLAMEAIRGGSQQNIYDSSGKLANVILAAPDIDYELFAAQVSSIPPEKRRFFVLISDDDEALRLSSFLARRPRVGNVGADRLTQLGVNVIDLSQVKDTSSIHHSKFTDAPEVVQLLGARILAGDSHTTKDPSLLGQGFIVGTGGVLQLIE
ncbi:alpha/beta hydrolase [Aliiruegeria lutimaris]|uniref:Esterase/lipase superfamily enzyme n=1 Tax=Aliiruegeria lutimaris TaxID=571298 RepID=A0A1G9AHU9_9RHOB|nr:alpha/beta hydrolase [Aliiruegeria lutimaris]SDK26140.1 Esterase/lipase superfamily enzyme [Aliiruegeria lutimaris]